jgi:NAD(P)-dependent dehydrogenase (short-subunit alcohol dehydrogenase family)
MTLFDGKVVVVTGGGSGIGQAACHLYARESARIVVSDIDEQGGNETVRAVQEMNCGAIFVRADVANPEDCQAMEAAALENTDDWILPSIMLASEARQPSLAILDPLSSAPHRSLNLKKTSRCRQDHLISLHPMGRLGESEEVAELVIRLSSDQASFVTGAYYPIDGGYLARYDESHSDAEK